MAQNEKRPYSITDVRFPNGNKKNNYEEKQNNRKSARSAHDRRDFDTAKTT